MRNEVYNGSVDRSQVYLLEITCKDNYSEIKIFIYIYQKFIQDFTIKFNSIDINGIKLPFFFPNSQTISREFSTGTQDATSENQMKSRKPPFPEARSRGFPKRV